MKKLVFLVIVLGMLVFGGNAIAQENQAPVLDQISEYLNTLPVPIEYLLMGSAIILFILLLLSVVANIRKNKRLKRFLPVVDIEGCIQDLNKEKFKINTEIETAKELQQKLASEYTIRDKQLSIDHEVKKKKLIAEYRAGQLKYNDLKKQLSEFETDLGMIDLGFYKPTFEFDTSEAYKSQINLIKGKQKQLVQQKKACLCETEWQVGGSKAEGRKMTTRTINLAIRAFNGECDAATSNTRWNNYDVQKKRITRSFEYINKQNEPNHTYLTDTFLVYKLKELDATFKYKEKKEEEKEEQRVLNEQIREEKKIEAEIKKAELDAKKKEVQALKDAKIAEAIYNKAMKEFELAGDEEKEAMKEQLATADKILKEAREAAHQSHDETTRISSMAQHTKAGRVYILSNIGSFGSRICKIGMTRALDPMDRVKNLSGASVPFEFDCHAMITTTDAPGLEHALHKHFSDRRVNLANMRKEYFYVTLNEIQKWLNENGHEKVELITEVESRTYMETLAMRRSGEKASKPDEDIIELTEEVLFGED